MTRVFDAFLYAGEADILECRLRELDGTAVYRHVIVESALTHRGPAKPLSFADQQERFAPWKDRIVHVTADLDPAADWSERISAQRDHVRQGLAGADPDDIVIMSDADEIISPLGVEVALRGEPVLFQQRHALFCADWEAADGWSGPSAAPLRTVDRFSAFRHSGRHTDEGGGWHLSWLGGPDAVRAKIGRHGHTEMDTRLLEGLADGSFLRRGTTWDRQCTAAEVDETWPRWVYERQCPPEWFRAHWQ